MDRIEKLRKIKELAEKGVGGEREAALETYARLKALYNISDDLITEPELSNHYFKFESEVMKRLLHQVIYSVCGSEQIYTIHGLRKQLYVRCTDFEAAEIGLLYDVYKHELKKTLKAAYLAFINANDIFPDENVRVPPIKREKTELTEEEKQALRLMGGIDKTTIPRGLIEE